MKYASFLLALFLVCNLSAQDANVVDKFNTITTLNDSTWQVRGYKVNQYSIVYQGQEYTYLDTVLIPDATALFDSAGIVRYLTVSTTNEQGQQAAVVARSFENYTRHRNVTDANNLIDQITGGASNYREEASKLWADELAGTYRVQVDSSGTTLDFFAKMELFSTVSHPDGRAMKLTRCTDISCETLTDQSWFVQPYHRWKLRLNNFYDESPFYVWDRISPERPLYRPDVFAVRQQIANGILKIK